MGLMMPALRYLAREHRRQPITGRVLTLGRQCVYATLTDVREMLRSEGIDPEPLRSEADRFSNIPGWSDGPRAQYTSDKAFWTALAGVDVETLDVSDYEGAEHLVDLNRPIPDALAGQFDVVLDGGTLEHVFDTAQAVRNLVSLLRVGGRMLHMSPGSNYFEHGFYQFSPTFFFDYYGANGFADLACSVAEIPAGSDWATTEWAFRDCNPARPVETASPHYQLVLFRATKVAGSTADRVPRQGDYRAALRQAAQQREGRPTGDRAMTAQREPEHAPELAFEWEERFCWIVKDVAQALAGEAPDEAVRKTSRVTVVEDGQPLPFPHAPHEMIRSVGSGRFSHWRDGVRFSTSDNSNPATNGRTYHLEAGDRRVRLAPARMSPQWAATVEIRLAERRARVSDVDTWCRHAEGFAWAVNLEELVRRGLIDASPNPESITVREDGHALVRAAEASAVGISGGGTFWMESPRLLFSSTDQTNPKLNGRRYELTAAGRTVVIPPSPQAAVLGPASEPPGGHLRDFVRATVDAGQGIRLDVPHALDYYHFLAGLMRVNGFTRMLEIGMERGYSAAAAATGMGDTIDTLVTCDLADRAPILNRRPGVHKVIGDVMDVKNVRRILHLFQHKPIDVLFVDSGHDYPTTVAHMGTFATLLQPRLILIDDIVLNEDMARFWFDVRAMYGPRAVNACDIDPRVRTCECGFGMVVLDESVTQSARDVRPAA